MPIENIPEIYLKDRKEAPDLLIHDFKMKNEVVNSKVNLGMHMFSFLQVGKKYILQEIQLQLIRISHYF